MLYLRQRKDRTTGVLSKNIPPVYREGSPRLACSRRTRSGTRHMAAARRGDAVHAVPSNGVESSPRRWYRNDTVVFLHYASIYRWGGVGKVLSGPRGSQSLRQTHSLKALGMLHTTFGMLHMSCLAGLRHVDSQRTQVPCILGDAESWVRCPRVKSYSCESSHIFVPTEAKIKSRRETRVDCPGSENILGVQAREQPAEPPWRAARPARPTLPC